MSAADPADASVDTDSPWLGLASFTEATRGYFYGREQEITELERRVQRKLLTVLFGKSGLGKTSILQAGLVPGLRARGYFPVYLRIDYGHDSPEASEQIKQAINRAAVGRTGEAAPTIDPDESIWEFLHHREVPQDSGAVPQDVSAATRTVKSPATQTTAAAPTAPLGATAPPRLATPPAPTAPLGATASTVPLRATAPPIATAPPAPAAPLGATAPRAAASHRPSAPPTAIPLLIFDQFEELFTLAQSDEFGRARAARFVEELADLVENRPPQALEAKLDSDDSLSERFDFSRSDYRVVISLREDYLAPLESLKKQMPSLSQNRLRLAPMTGDQALEAVLLPGQRLAEDSVLPGRRRGAGAAQWSGRPLEAGGQLGAGAAGPLGAGTPLEPETAQVPGRPPGAGRALVSQEVAEAIVRFVAGGAELANAEVEPSLLSLICRELNEQRIAQGRAEISLDLLAGSHETILSSFYERALADQPPAVRSLIEDELLTESGYRENLAEESLLRKLQTAGAAPDALAKLVNRRLLRIEERLDVRRVELTHDVLTGVVKASRDQRHEREARAATERLLAEQAARESAARRALRRARAIAAGCTALAVAAVIAALFAVINVQRARHAEADARQTRAVSEQARLQAEGLLGFLTDDFVRELETFGRYQTIADLSQREIDYFRALPPQLKDPQSIRNGALALVNHANALVYLGDIAGAAPDATQAIALLEALARTDEAVATTVVLAQAYAAQASVLFIQENPKFSAVSARAAAVLRPVAQRPDAPVEAVRVYGENLAAIAFVASLGNQGEEAVRDASEAMRLAAQLRGRRDDVTLEADYAYAGIGLVGGLQVLGRDEEALRAGKDAVEVADRVLAQRPQYSRALIAKQVIEEDLVYAAGDQLDPVQAGRFGLQAIQTSLALVRVEPQNLNYINNLGITEEIAASAFWQAGRLDEAVVHLHESVEDLGRASQGGALQSAVDMLGAAFSEAVRRAQLGDFPGSLASLARTDALLGTLRKLSPAQAGSIAVVSSAVRARTEATVSYERDEFDAARRIARRALAATAPLPAGISANVLFWLSDLQGHAEYALGDFAEAARSEGAALRAVKTTAGRDVIDQREVAQVAIWLAMAQAREGKRTEAAATIGPLVTMYRALAARNHGDRWLPLELAEALYVESLTDAARRPALLREAAGLVGHLTPVIATLHDTRAWRARIEGGGR